MIVRVRAEEDKISEVLDVLRPLGIELITGEETVMESALFYLARMNTKLDNLGQLRHLHKVLMHVGDIKNEMKTIAFHFYQKNEEVQARQNASINYYNYLHTKFGSHPESLIPIRFLTLKEIDELFRSTNGGGE